MDHLPSLRPVAVAFFIVWTLFGATVYYAVARFLLKGGGKVDTLAFRNADLWVAVGFVTWFALLILGSFDAPQHDVTEPNILCNAGLYVGIVAALGIFMQWRGINPLRQFGLTRLNPFTCMALAVGFMIATHPITLITEFTTFILMHGQTQPQNVIEYFLHAAQRSDSRAVALMLVVAVVIAPLAEETIFRGYLYGVFKRYLGGIGAGLLTAGLFAAMHLNLAALPSLFVLALCLTLAYEATGSLLVNIFMHGLFNLSSLLAIMYFTKHSPAP